MARWKENELKVIEEYIQDHPGLMSTTDNENMVALLWTECASTRTVAAVKKKVGELKRSQTNQAIPRRATTFTSEEIKLLLNSYKQAEGNSKVEKVRKI